MQQQQMTVMRDGIVAAQQTATAAVERATATAATTPHGQRPGSIANFMKLNPKAFTGNEEPLAAEQWLTDMTNFLEAANIPASDHVKVVKIQLKGIARSWWLAEEGKQQGQLTWKQFSDGFYERFFPQTAKQEMGEKFLRLKQWDKTVDQYAAEFQRLSRFAPNMVREEIDRASRLQQGLRIIVKKHLASHQLDTYDQVLTASRRVERVENEENQNGQQK